jgi:hypothetical protein
LDPVDTIKRAQDANLVDEDGDAVALELQPRLSEAEIDALAAEARRAPARLKATSDRPR